MQADQGTHSQGLGKATKEKGNALRGEMPSGHRAYTHPYPPEQDRNIMAEMLILEQVGFLQLPVKLGGVLDSLCSPHPCPGQHLGNGCRAGGGTCLSLPRRVPQVQSDPTSSRYCHTGSATPYLRRSQNISMISKSDWTHKSREKSSNWSRETRRDFSWGLPGSSSSESKLNPFLHGLGRPQDARPGSSPEAT